MSTLHDTLTEYLSTQEGSPKLKKLAIEQLENRITQEIVEQEATKIENKALELQRERTEKERYEKKPAYQGCRTNFFGCCCIRFDDWSGGKPDHRDYFFHQRTI